MIKKQYVLALALLVNMAPLQGKEITMAFGMSLPPYVISEDDSGIEIEIIRESLKFKGHSLKPLYVPLARVPLYFIQNKVDAVQRDGGIDLTSHNGFYADTSISYQDVLVTLAERNLSLENPEDISGLKVTAFQGAFKQYPSWFAEAKEAGTYYEQNNQVLQVRTLHNKRYDVVVADKNIVAYFTNMVRKEGKIKLLPTKTHYFTERYSYSPVFKDAQTMADFNEGLNHLHQSGRYQEIVDSYIDE